MTRSFFIRGARIARMLRSSRLRPLVNATTTRAYHASRVMTRALAAWLSWSESAKKPAVHRVGWRRDMTNTVAEEKTNHFGHLFGRPDTTDGHVSTQLVADELPRCIWIELHQHGCLDEAGDDAIDANVVWSRFDRRGP